MELALAHNHSKRDIKLDSTLTYDDGVLPTDILSDVLLRLPTKALCRLCLVCRSWRTLTSDPIFVQAHTSRHLLIAGLHQNLPEIHIVELLSGDVIRKIPVPRSRFDLTTQLDMLCVSTLQGPIGVVLEKGQHKLSALPELPQKGEFKYFQSIISYVLSTGEYKVLQFQCCCNTNHGYVQPCYVITLLNGGKGTWRMAPHPAAPIEPTPRNRAVIGGVAYFFMHEYFANSITNLEPDSVASFDLATEEWKPTPLRGPLSSLLSTRGDKLSYNKHRKDFQLTELRGTLAIVHYKYQDCLMDIWFLMDTDSCIWNKRYSLKCAQEWVKGRSLYPLVVLHNERIVVWNDFGSIIRAYDSRTSTWTRVKAAEGLFVVVPTYVESLLSCS